MLKYKDFFGGRFSIIVTPCFGVGFEFTDENESDKLIGNGFDCYYDLYEIINLKLNLLFLSLTFRIKLKKVKF